MAEHQELLFLVGIITFFLASCLITESQAGDLSKQDCLGYDVTYYYRLKDTYEMKYVTDGTNITVCVKVRTTGFVGFGLSPKGSMQGADILMAGVANGKVYWKDLYGERNGIPKKDTQSDWFVLKGVESGGYTTLVFTRRLNTCDPNDGQDFVIGNGTTRVIWSFGKNDPGNKLGFKDYHGRNRGTKSLLLLDPPLLERTADHLNKTDPIIKNIQMKMDNYHVPNSTTTYACKMLRLPQDIINNKHHIIRWEPLLDPKHPELIHHVCVYTCLGDDNDVDLGDQHTCFNFRPPGQYVCEKDVFVVWTVGGSAYDFPTNVGQPIGGPNRHTVFKLEVHYNNVAKKNGIIDNSGVNLIVTTNPRPIDAGLWRIGSRISNNHVIPPRFDALLTRTYCLPQCFQEYMDEENKDNVTIIGGLLHTHLAGRQMVGRHFRGQKELKPILEDKYYDFDYQEIRSLHEPVEFRKGDWIVTDCTYGSKDRDRVTPAGFPTEHEMCFLYLIYYPEMNMTSCESDVIWTKDVVGHTDDFDNKTLYDWNNPAVRDKFVRDQDGLKFTQFCYGVTHDPKFNGTVHPQPTLNNTYQHPDQCSLTCVD